ncbi:MAG: formate-dependent phosphoribosylglycinamide formyltransferase [Flavobacteriales bacterium]
MKKIVVLGSGELGKEFVIAAKRLGQYVVAVDSYDNAPAMQVSDERAVINMLDKQQLEDLVNKHNPDIIVPEIEAIRTECFYEFEKQGIQIVPSARAANYTMNRKAIRDLASLELGLKTAYYTYATSEEELLRASEIIGFPCVVKPLMSSSGKGQSVMRSEQDIANSWKYAVEGSRGDLVEVIVEQFIEFDFEITLLTVTQKNGETLFCAPIGHVQERGDYQQSWQPMPMKSEHIKDAQEMAAKVTSALTGSGIWGVEFFVSQKDGVYFSELSPRPHDTGMVTLANTQNLNEFELHARAVLDLPIPQISLEKAGVSAVILAHKEGGEPVFKGVEKVLAEKNTDVKLFGKPTARPYRRMGVVLLNGDIHADIQELMQRARELASEIIVD